MTSPPAQPGRRRQVAWGIAGAVAVLGLVAALAVFATRSGAELERDLVVVFRPEATREDAERVQRSCAHVTGVRAVLAEPGGSAAARRYPLHYDVSEATLRERSALYDCVLRDPSVLQAREPTGL